MKNWASLERADPKVRSEYRGLTYNGFLKKKDKRTVVYKTPIIQKHIFSLPGSMGTQGERLPKDLTW